MRDYQSMGGMEAQDAGAPSYATSNRGQESAYGAELRFGTPTSSVIARVPNTSPDQPAGTDSVDGAIALEHGLRAWFSRKAIAGVLAVVVMAAVSPWIVSLLRDKTETGGSADAKSKAPDSRVELPAPNESTAPTWAGANNDTSHFQTADARVRGDLADPDDADADANRRDARRPEARRPSANPTQEPRNTRGLSDAGRDDSDDSRSSGRYGTRPTTRRTTAEPDADRGAGQRGRASGIAGRTPSRSTTLNERGEVTPPAGDRFSTASGSASDSRSRYDGDDARGDLRAAARSSSRYDGRSDTDRDEAPAGSRRRSAYDASDTAADRPLEKSRSSTTAYRNDDSPARDRDDVASRRGGSLRDRSSADATARANPDDARAAESVPSRTGDRSSAPPTGRFSEGRYAPPTTRTPVAGRRGGDDREAPYGFSRRDGEATSRAGQGSRGTDPADGDPRDESPRYPETRSKSTDRDDYGSERSTSSRISSNGTRDVRSASYDSTEQDVARFQGGIEEPTYRTSNEHPRSSIR